MNATERDQLQQFLSALRQTRAEPKDTTADSLIREAVRAQADAPYLLVQRAMGLDLALHVAQRRIAQLEAQCAQQLDQLAQFQRSPLGPAPATDAQGSWISGGQAWGRGTETPAPPQPATSRFASGSSSAAALPVQGRGHTSAWGGGMLTQLATTAAGVVAGGLLFQGIQNLMGQHPPTPDANAASPMSNAQEDALPDGASQQAGADDAGDTAWDAGEDWA